MSMYRVALPVSILVGLILTGCSSKPSFVAEVEPWRGDDERACLASGAVRETPFVQSRSALGGPSVCGALRPFEMSAALGGRVSLKPAALLRCPMVPMVDHWVSAVIEPAARRYLGISVGELKIAGSYGCRPRNGIAGGKLSEHGHANALDIASFVLINGRIVTVKDGWFGREDERAFLRAVHRGACEHFTTVLGPNADSFHRDHFHVDLARHGRDGSHKVCK